MDDEQIVELYKQNFTLRQIAQKVRGVQSIWHVLSVLKSHPESGYQPLRRRTRRSKYFYDENFFETIDTEAKAYYFGLFVTDGWMKVNRGVTEVPVAICYELVLPDRELLDTLHNLMGPMAPPVVERHLKTEWSNSGLDKARLVFHSKKMCDDLIAKGCNERKTYTLGKISQYVPKELHRHYVRGCFDGDGGWTIEKYRLRASFRGTLPFLEDLKGIIPVEMCLIKSQKWPTLKTNKHREAVKFYEWLYQDATIWLRRKREKCESALVR